MADSGNDGFGSLNCDIGRDGGTRGGRAELFARFGLVEAGPGEGVAGEAVGVGHHDVAANLALAVGDCRQRAGLSIRGGHAKPEMDGRLYLSHLWTAEGWLYVAAVIDFLASGRRLVDAGHDGRAARHRMTVTTSRTEVRIVPPSAAVASAQAATARHRCASTTPRSGSKARGWLINAVRSHTSLSRARYGSLR